MNNAKKYKMGISLNVLNHLGLNLYSNTPAVIAEVIANAWDADASRVDINYDMGKEIVTVKDDGCGMSVDDINKKYLHIGYQKREHETGNTPQGRKFMGRKGIGKLSLFSIANEIRVQSVKDGEKNALLMDGEKIKEAIKGETPGTVLEYNPDEVEFDESLSSHSAGTVIQISKLKKKLTQLSVNGLKKRLARRFSVIEDGSDFEIFLNGGKITYADRDYFHKARFLFQYGEDFSRHCKKLDEDEQNPCAYWRDHKFGEDGRGGSYQIKGWIAVAHHSNDLDDKVASTDSNEPDDNLNNIVIVVRGKVAQEDILHQIRMGGLITKYLYGEIEADFLDDDSEEDIATSSRQKIMEDAPRYQALKKFLEDELRHIWSKTNTLKEKKGVEKALGYHPKIKEWYGKIHPNLKKKADILFGGIERIEVDEKEKATLYVNGILAFEKMKMEHTLEQIHDDLDPARLDAMLNVFKGVDEIEAGHYYEIVNERLQVISALQKLVTDDAKEKVIQGYIFNHLWLLDPAWERATSDAEMEQAIQQILKDESGKGKEAEKSMRIDIQYRKVSGAHVIIELKRASKRIGKSDLERQIRKYMHAVEGKLNTLNKSSADVEGICLVGKLPLGWDNSKTKREEVESLKSVRIKVLTYDELINNAHSAYAKFIKAKVKVGELRQLIQEIRNIPKSEN